MGYQLIERIFQSDVFVFNISMTLIILPSTHPEYYQLLATGLVKQQLSGMQEHIVSACTWQNFQICEPPPPFPKG